MIPELCTAPIYAPGGGGGEEGGRRGIGRTDRQTDMFVYLESYTINIHRLLPNN